MTARFSARHLTELATRHLVLRRRLPTPFEKTRIYVSAEGGLKYLRLSLARADPLLISLTQEIVRPGDVVWDVGANVGLFTFAAASAAGPTGSVLALEPDTWTANLLSRSLRIPNRRAPIEVLTTAAGATTGVGRFCVAARNRATSHLWGFGTSQTGGVRTVQPVPVFALDDLLAHFPAPQILKIDVEGAEQTVFDGARRILREARPTILCEVGAQNSQVVTEILRENRYQVFDGEQNRPRRPTVAGWCTLAVPDEADVDTADPRETPRASAHGSARAVPASDSAMRRADRTTKPDDQRRRTDRATSGGSATTQHG